MAEQSEATEERENLLLPGEARWEGEDGEPIIELVDVYKSFGEDHVLKGLSLKVMPGKITIIIGASGSGKSVLIKHMNGLLRPDKGSVRLFGQDVSELGDQALDRLRKRVGTMFQNYALFDSLTVRENVAFALVEHGAMARAKAEELAETIIKELDLGHALDQYPATLSGGMKKRVSLARAIVSNPEVVLFDEPTTGLDPVMMEFVDKLVEEITHKYQLTSVLISHDLATIFRIADQVAVLADGQIICVGRPEEIRESEDPRVQELIGGKAKSQIEVHASDDSEQAEMIVRMEGVHKGWGNNQVLRGVDFEVPTGKLTTLIGGSGSGKSVMMKHLLGLLKADRGTVEVFGQDLSKLSEGELRELRTKVGMLFQHAALFDSMSVRENVAFPLVERRVCSRKEAHERTDRLLDQLKLMDIAEQVPVQISSGQQKRVSLARALVTEPQLLIYDEPTTGQDPIMSLYVEEMIMEVQESFDVTSIVISHDMASAFRTADMIAMLHKGEIIACGPPQVIADSEDERVRNFVYAADVAAQEREAASRREGGG
ncbi:ABC transporter ATP-binding protein [Lujinxingia vulgaris]|uniref:ABC transporter ATP-binding protein n=1 Tax=Lujinxingia vulgaris TaxID=2600176 RepID=A0A5C6X884_9DELT|nr:ATP-binding cassette domain-containing protein [Lujinxingia vulgaris]TXD37558.1 ABC transporter ATP-binding protein [Lujinxingia vulgaris]